MQVYFDVTNIVLGVTNIVLGVIGDGNTTNGLLIANNIYNFYQVLSCDYSYITMYTLYPLVHIPVAT